MWHSRLCKGTVRHRRFEPQPHSFEYNTFYFFLDLDEIEELFSLNPFYSMEKRNLVSFYRKDYLQSHPDRDLKEAVIKYYQDQSGQNFDGKVFMLAHLRYWGYTFNPVVFYYGYHEPPYHSTEPAFILAEITNTPWDEKFCYLLETRHCNDKRFYRNGHLHQFDFNKDFHVSPFMPMDLEYQWRFFENSASRHVHMKLCKNNATMFDATLKLKTECITPEVLYKAPLRYGLTTTKVISAIYYQALKLWLKGTPFYEHPKNRRDTLTEIGR